VYFDLLSVFYFFTFHFYFLVHTGGAVLEVKIQTFERNVDLLLILKVDEGYRKKKMHKGMLQGRSGKSSQVDALRHQDEAKNYSI